MVEGILAAALAGCHVMSGDEARGGARGVDGSRSSAAALGLSRLRVNSGQGSVHALAQQPAIRGRCTAWIAADSLSLPLLHFLELSPGPASEGLP
ncbi:hypothetical protein [Paenarthrobacter ilicis]|uniref:hypothetical protein n=1 Tax=Paenarthrobacter ilicis TaxID=43665 RepID=UPI0028D17C3B|nr:hypothetical protein [Paenarthrobacter ilicis]